MSDVLRFPPRGKYGRFRARIEGDHVVVEIHAPWLSKDPVAAKMDAARADEVSRAFAAYAHQLRVASLAATHAKIEAEAPAKARSLIRVVTDGKVQS